MLEFHHPTSWYVATFHLPQKSLSHDNNTGNTLLRSFCVYVCGTHTHTNSPPRMCDAETGCSRPPNSIEKVAHNLKIPTRSLICRGFHILGTFSGRQIFAMIKEFLGRTRRKPPPCCIPITRVHHFHVGRDSAMSEHRQVEFQFRTLFLK